MQRQKRQPGKSGASGRGESDLGSDRSEVNENKAIEADNNTASASEPNHPKNHAGQNINSVIGRPNIPTPPSSSGFTTQVTLTRAKAMEMLEPWLSRARQEKFSGAVNDQLALRVKKEIVQVMDADIKAWLRIWATIADKPDIVKWVDDAKEDRETVEYAEVRRRPGPFPWSDTSLAEKTFKELLSFANDQSVAKALRQRMTMMAWEVSHYVHGMEAGSHLWGNVEGVMKSLDAIRDAIRDEGKKTRDLIRGEKRTHGEAFDHAESDL